MRTGVVALWSTSSLRYVATVESRSRPVDDALRQLELAQGKGVHLRRRLLKQVAQVRMGRRQVLFAGLPAIQQSYVPTDHDGSPFPSCFRVASK